MNDYDFVSVIGEDGKVRMKDRARANELVKTGKFRLFNNPNPNKMYYPQYDRTSGSPYAGKEVSLEEGRPDYLKTEAV